MTRSFLPCLLLLVWLPGCLLKPEGCSTEARSSVTLSVVDDAGAPVPGVTATWSEAGGEATACEAIGDTYACGWEVSGTLTLRVDAPGYQPWSAEVEVAEDECHVITELVEAVLTPVPDCTDVEIPSVLATVLGAEGEALEGVEVRWQPTGAEKDHPCDAYDDRWACGWEVAGSLTVTATAAGHTTESVDVVVTADECHVQTEAVTFELDWLPD